MQSYFDATCIIYAQQVEALGRLVKVQRSCNKPVLERSVIEVDHRGYAFRCRELLKMISYTGMYASYAHTHCCFLSFLYCFFYSPPPPPSMKPPLHSAGDDAGYDNIMEDRVIHYDRKLRESELPTSVNDFSR